MDTKNSNPILNPSDKHLPPQPVSNSINNLKGLLLIISAVLVLLVIVGGGGYVLGTKQLSTSNIPFQNPTTYNQTTSTTDIKVSPIGNNTKIEKQIGYLRSVFDKNNSKYLTIDYIQWLNQTDGTCRIESEESTNTPVCNPNGYLIVNDNPQLRTFEISLDSVIDFSDYKTAGMEWKNKQQLKSSYLTLSDLQEIFSEKDSEVSWLKDALFHIEITDNKITKIKYQYQP